MPLIRLETSQPVPPGQKASLCASLSRVCAETIGKPESYVMAIIEDGLTVLHGGAPGPAAFVDVRSIGGLSPKVNRAIAERVCRLLADTLSIPGERVYLNLTDVSGDRWGHNGSTFG
jgi:phenylpyruvate tautomerase